MARLSLLIVCFTAAMFQLTTVPPIAQYRAARGTTQGVDCFHTTMDGLPTCVGPVLLPDPQVTPGKVRSSDANQVCHGGSTKQFRHTTSQDKNTVYALYGAKKLKDVCCEVDHLISLELGGADELPNLWPQPYEPRPGAHEKDAVENWLHAQVCAGKMPLTEAQSAIAIDWYDVYLKMKAEKN